MNSTKGAAARQDPGFSLAQTRSTLSLQGVTLALDPQHELSAHSVNCITTRSFTDQRAMAAKSLIRTTVTERCSNN